VRVRLREKKGGEREVEKNTLNGGMRFVLG
jgi:hypothetical protein